MYNYCRNHQCSYLNDLHKLEPRKEITKKQHWWQLFSPSEEFQCSELEIIKQCQNCDSFIKTNNKDHDHKIKEILDHCYITIRCQVCGQLLTFDYDTGYILDLYCHRCKKYSVATHSLKRLLGGI